MGHLSGSKAQSIFKAAFLSKFVLSETIDLKTDNFRRINWLSIEPISNKLLLACEDDGTISAFNLQKCSAENSEPFTIVPFKRISRAHDSTVTGIEWYPIDPGLFTTCGYDGTLKVWDANEFENIFDFELDFRISNHAMSLNGFHTLVLGVGLSNQIKVCDLRTGVPVIAIHGAPNSNTVASWSTKYEFIFSAGGSDGSISLYDIRMPKQRLFSFLAESSCTAAHSRNVNGISFINNGNSLISTGVDQSIKLWDTVSGQCLHIYNPKPPGFNSDNINYAKKISFADYKRDSLLQNELNFVSVYGTNSIAVGNLPTDNPAAINFQTLIHGQIGVSTSVCFRHGYNQVYSAGSDGNIIMFEPEPTSKLSQKQLKIREDTW